jgi:hypothetical protein
MSAAVTSRLVTLNFGKRRALAPERDMGENQVRSRGADIDAHAFEREHLQSFDVGDDLILFNDEIIRMVVIVNVIVH